MISIKETIPLLISRKELMALYLLFFGMLLSAFVQIIGVASIAPFMAVVLDNEIIHSNQYLSFAYEYFEFSNKKQFLVWLGVVVIVLLVITNFLSGLMIWATNYFGQMHGHNIACRLLENYLLQPYSFHLTRNSADLGKNILTEASRLVDGVIISVLNIVSKSIITFFILTILIILNPIVSVTVSIIIGGSYLIIYKMLRIRLNFLGAATTKNVLEKYKAVNEAMGGIKEINLRKAGAEFLHRFSVPSENYAKDASQATTLAYIPRYLLETVAFGGLVFIVVYLIGNGHTGGNIIPLLSLYALAGYRLLPAMQTIYQSFTTLRFNIPVLEIIIDDLSNKVKPHKLSDRGVSSIKIQSVLHLKDVNFHYPGSDKYILNNLSVDFQKNTTIGLVGSTGTGKTTLIDIILGLLHPISGKFDIDGLEITKDNVSLWQRNLSYVPQSIYLSDDSIQNNIAYSIPNSEIDIKRVHEVAKLAQLNQFVESLPEQYETIVGERGVRLSGGQRQRIGIARALYTDPQLLVLDEATSSLDGITENIIMDAVHNLSHKMTIIMIAHRLSSVKECDVIHMMQNGSIIISGNYNDLISSNAQFRKMANF
jgi:ATP-binding cassette, subfamily B, bacterial PglK